jgi:hypothetical protein
MLIRVAREATRCLIMFLVASYRANVVSSRDTLVQIDNFYATPWSITAYSSTSDSTNSLSPSIAFPFLKMNPLIMKNR